MTFVPKPGSHAYGSRFAACNECTSVDEHDMRDEKIDKERLLSVLREAPTVERMNEMESNARAWLPADRAMPEDEAVNEEVLALDVMRLLVFARKARAAADGDCETSRMCKCGHSDIHHVGLLRPGPECVACKCTSWTPT